MNEKIIWIGIRESEIFMSNLFYKSITIYGSNTGNNISYKNDVQQSVVDFFVDNINKQLKETQAKLFFYSNKIAERVLSKAPYLNDIIINRNDAEIIAAIENKTYSHLWVENIIPILPFVEKFGIECSYDNLYKQFKKYDKFIIQENYSSGGKGTFLLTKTNEKAIAKALNEHKCYKVSPYLEHSISVNVHILISKDYVSVLQPSIQIIENINNNLLYKGADFIAYHKISSLVKNKIFTFAKKIGQTLFNIGYLGVCGLDLLIQDENVFFLEINPRFQASTILINRSLKDHSLPDLHTIVYQIYSNKCSLNILKAIEKIRVNYSTLSFYQTYNYKKNKHLLNSLLQRPKFLDTLIIENEFSDTLSEYMFRVIFNTNISSVNFDGGIFVYQNLLDYSKFAKDTYKRDLNMLKCALLTQGVTLYEDVKNLYNDSHRIKNATFDAVDIRINNDFVINCPTKIKFVELTPFSIRLLNNIVSLFYFDDFLCNISIDLQEKVSVSHTKNNINIHSIGFLTTDRLRIKHSALCSFKKQHKGCKFCHITSRSLQDIPLEDIYQTIDCYISSVSFNHFLIGGPSNSYDKEIFYIKNIAQHIRKVSNKPIYVMSIPPKDYDEVKNFCECGITEVAFNIEIYNRQIAKKIMPGKGSIPLKQYLQALENSSKLLGTENARSMLIIGLDSKRSFLKGVEQLCKIGVTPMISPFRPMENTPLADMVPPTLEYMLDIYCESKKICNKYNIRLGPKCVFCQNNTLT